MSICFCHPVLNPYSVGKRAYFEVLAHSLSLYAKISAVRHHLPFLDITYIDATRNILQATLESAIDIDTFIFAGHADECGTSLTGQGLHACLDICNAKCLEGKKVYLISCNTAMGLARRAVDAGARFVIAFEGKVFLMSRKQEAVVSACLIDQLLLARQDDPDVIFQSMLMAHESWIYRILDHHKPSDAWLLALSVLDWNMEHLRLVSEGSLEKGVSLLPKIDNSDQKFSDLDLEDAINYVRRAVQEGGILGNAPEVVSGNGEDLSPAAILRELEDRQRSGNWGRDDFVERYLLSVLKVRRSASQR